jgi:hypothetical protein
MLILWKQKKFQKLFSYFALVYSIFYDAQHLCVIEIFCFTKNFALWAYLTLLIPRRYRKTSLLFHVAEVELICLDKVLTGVDVLCLDTREADLDLVEPHRRDVRRPQSGCRFPAEDKVPTGVDVLVTEKFKKVSIRVSLYPKNFCVLLRSK